MTYTINNLDWTVSYAIQFDDQDTLGECDFRNLEIRLLQGLKQEVKRRTLIHEVTHAFIFSYGLDEQTYDDEFLCRFLESHGEKIIQTADGILNTSRG